ncbi:HesA/MoeB/ThiF family protein [Nigerium massiliense]|uniref:HesA/MoeB/ThiF family protein n=1 Tax=Nigerium massiliense TaxID=1522317 RepID=UPI000693AFA4|nr:HesA/MoeB/ThiF family protein [Nigerium massiliense]
MSEVWNRQERLLGEEGQARVRASSAMVVGCGGLGAGCIPALVASGVGRLTLVDDDVVAESNLNRQTLFTAADIGSAKVDLATARMRGLAPWSDITGLRHRLSADDVDLVRGHDLLIDCTDAVASRHVISALAEELQIPWVWAAIDGWSAIVSVFVPGDVRWQDAFGHVTAPSTPPQIMGAAPATAGAWEAAEAVKLLSGVGDPLIGRLAVIDLLTAAVDVLPLGR